MSFLHSILRPFRRSEAGAFEVRVVEKIRETADAATLRFVRQDRAPFVFSAGQFLTFVTRVAGEELKRSYSFSSSPSQGLVASITVKRVGRASRYLVDHVEPGMRLRAMGPFGGFTLEGADPGDHWVFVAGGSGITPIASMLTQVPERTEVDLLFGNRRMEDVIFRERLSRARHFLEEPSASFACTQGRLDGDAVMRAIEWTGRQRYWVCGPTAMMESVVASLRAKGVPEARIKTESFSHVSAGNGESHTIEFRRSRRTLTSNDTVLGAGLAAGLDLDRACEMGECGTCRVRLLEGEVDEPPCSGLDERERAEGYVLACVSRPRGRVVVDA